MNAHTPMPDAAAGPKSGVTAAAVDNIALLRALASGEHKTLTSAAAAAGIAKNNMTRHVNLLARDGLLEPEGEGLRPLTDHGRKVLALLDLQAGATAGAEADPDAEEVLIAHHHLRPNPANPRRYDENDPLQVVAVEQLAATIVATGCRLLHNLVVYPADADGVHDIGAGERRWRAIGLLIERKIWPEAQKIRCVVRERPPGDAAFVALVENGQRANLSLIEEARAYETLCGEKNWSARKAAQETGRDERTVQQMLQVLREADPADIAAHEAGDPAMKWEALRDSVKDRKAAPVAEPHQPDLAEAADPLVVNGVRFPNLTLANQTRHQLAGGAPANTGGGAARGDGGRAAEIAAKDKAKAELTRRDELALLELAHKVDVVADASGWVPVRSYWLHGTHTKLSDAGLIRVDHNAGKHHGALGVGPWAALTPEGEAKVAMDGRDLETARNDAGVDMETDYGRYITEWLNEDQPVAATFTPAPGPGDAAPAAEAEDEAQAEQAALDEAANVKDAVLALLADAGGGWSLGHLLATAGFPSALTVGDAEDTGIVRAKDGGELLTIDTGGAAPDDLVTARAMALAYVVSALVGQYEADRQDAEAAQSEAGA